MKMDMDLDALGAYLTAATIFWAASAMVSAAMMGRPRFGQHLLAQLLVGALHAHDQRHAAGSRPCRR
jgi:hypothetical protein